MLILTDMGEKLHPEQNSEDQTEKEAKWHELETQISEYADALGMPVDEGIKETVIALTALGFPTVQSCEGHSDRGNPFPWVTIEYPDEPEENKFINEDSEKDYTPEYKEWMKNNSVLQKKIDELIAEFNEKRTETAEEVRLRNRFGQVCSDTREFPYSDEGMATVKQAQFRALLSERQKEMHAFTAYLKEKFFQK